MNVTRASLAMMRRHIEAAHRQAPRGTPPILRRHVRILTEDLERAISEIEWLRDNPSPSRRRTNGHPSDSAVTGVNEPDTSSMDEPPQGETE